MTFDTLRVSISDDIEDTIQITEWGCNTYWKWERRLIQPTAAKKQPLPWNKLLLERNRDTVTNTLQVANSKKNGTYTLLKMQVTSFLKSERSDESGDFSINESSGRVVCASFALLIIDCDISISFKLRAYYLFHILKFIKELQTKYRCLDCDPRELSGTGYKDSKEFTNHTIPCWITVISTHGQLTSSRKRRQNCFPPRIPEFDNLILESLLKKYKP